MRGQKRVEDARERAYHPRIHLLRKKSFETGWIAGSKPGNDASLWFDMNASRFSDAGLSELQLGRADLPRIPFDRFTPSAVPAAQRVDSDCTAANPGDAG